MNKKEWSAQQTITTQPDKQSDATLPPPNTRLLLDGLMLHHLRNSVMTCESVIRRFVDFFFCRETTLGGSSASVLVDGLDEFSSGCEGASSIVTFLTELDKSSVGLG